MDMRKALLTVALALAATAAQALTGNITAQDGTVVEFVDRPDATVNAVVTGTWTATIVAEGSPDNGATWAALNMLNYATMAVVDSATANANFRLLVGSGTPLVRIRASAFTSGTIAVSLSKSQLPAPPFLFSSAGLLGSAIGGGQVAEKGARWRVTSTPAVSLQASASKAAGGSGFYHVVDCVGWSGGSTTAPALTKLNINLRDGATGAGTIIDSWTVVVSAATGQNVEPQKFCGLNYRGSDNTAMTLEFSALLTNLFQDVTLSGYTLRN